ncbi:hypothetical protein EBU95_10170 [bacterium]|nr:hypothetical protein [bacterium]
MKAIVQNYVTAFSTESMYITETINRISGCSAAYWKNNISAYDIFDTVKPDVFFTHASFLKKDTVEYLSNNANIECVFNITGLNQDVVNNINNLIKDQNIKCPLLYTNELNKNLKSKINLQYIPLGFDQYNPIIHDIPEYKIDLGCFSISKEVVVPEEFKTYHILGSVSNADIKSTILEIPSLCTRYKNFVICDDSNIVSQAFYTSLYYGTPTYYHTSNEKIKQAIKNITKCENTFDINNKEEYQWKDIQEQIKSKHTGANRVKTMFSNFSHDIATKIEIL